mgnify:CR=1 FL=1
MPTRYSCPSAVWVASAVPVVWGPWEPPRLPMTPVVPAGQAASTMPVERVEQVVWPLDARRDLEPADG